MSDPASKSGRVSRLGVFSATNLPGQGLLHILKGRHYLISVGRRPNFWTNETYHAARAFSMAYCRRQRMAPARHRRQHLY
jgi:hypothetical protein